MTKPTITLDSTQISVVVKCSACPWWHGFGFDRTHGWRVGADHQRSAHDDAAGNAVKTSQKRDLRGQ